MGVPGGISFPESALTWTGNGDLNGDLFLWDTPFQLEFSLAEHVSMSSRFRVFKMADKTPVKTLPGRERVCRCCNSDVKSNPIDLFGEKAKAEKLLSNLEIITGLIPYLVF